MASLRDDILSSGLVLAPLSACNYEADELPRVL